MIFISVDLECAQPEGTIIQIGAILRDTQNPSISIPFNYYVDPGHPIDWQYQLNNDKTMEQFLPEGFIDEWQVRKLPSIYALEDFWEWVKEHSAKKFIQWGSGDMDCILKESKNHHIKVPSYRNLKTLNLKLPYEYLFQSTTVARGHRSGLGAAVTAFNLKFEGHPHDAYWDAKATANVFMTMHQMIDIQGKISLLLNPPSLSKVLK